MNCLNAESIDALIEQSVSKHHSLENIKYHISSMDQKISKSRKWKNPDVSFTINDIQFEDPLDRGNERMQYQSINVKQTFPWPNKLDLKEDLKIEEKHVLLHSLESAKVELAYNIRISAYTIQEIKTRIAILNKYVRLEKQNINLLTDNISIGSNSHMQSIDSSLSLSNTQIKIERYKSMLDIEKEKLNYLAQKNIKNISTKLRIHKPKQLSYYLSRIIRNKSYHAKRALSDVAYANKDLVDMQAYPDPYVKIGYFNRSDFSDYSSIVVGVSFPIYGTEELNSEIARKELLASKSDYIDYKEKVKSNVRESYFKLKETYKIYKIIQNKSLPQLQHILDLSGSNIENGADLSNHTKLLEKKLLLEEKNVAIKAEFMRTKAKLNSLIGKI
jgi:outer membrane protein TolC